MPIYVEILIRGSLDEVWRRSQTPDLHEQWDLRFTTIEYLPRPDDSGPQSFRYATRLGLIEIAGWGRTSGETSVAGTRVSALEFGADDRKSLIREGGGYWKYEPAASGVRFLTVYDYRVRWGRLGRVVDRLVFRPLIGWATAWSFDRLRLWIERDVDPRGAANRSVMHAIATLGVAFVFVWHGLVPKLLGPHADELAMLVEAGVSVDSAPAVARWVGAGEIGFGLALPWIARGRAGWWMVIALMLGATIGVLIASPHRASAAFGPVSLNAVVTCLAAIGLLSRRDLPSARRCLRQPEPGNDPTPLATVLEEHL